MILSKFRRYLITAKNAAGIAKILTTAWNDIRKYQYFTLDVYARLKVIAIKRGIAVPETKVKMLAE